MPIRNSVKAVLLRDGKILCNRCAGESGAEYYALPGGGQRPFESMEEALAREVLEETGLTARAGRLLAVAEEIDCRAKARDFPEYAHRIQHIFLAEPAGEGEAVPPRGTGLRPDGQRLAPPGGSGPPALPAGPACRENFRAGRRKAPLFPGDGSNSRLTGALCLPVFQKGRSI